MKLSIIIPQYKEGEKVIFPLLASIDNQMMIDFNDIEVLVLNDGSNIILSDEFLNQFVNITPQYICLKKNVGLGMCRQAGLEHATGDYVMFCDADDRFFMNTALSLYFQTIAKYNPDFLSSRWYEELRKDGKSILVKHEADKTWTHTKMYRRQFLIDNDIKHHPQLRVHEDSYFTGLAYELAETTRHIQAETYVWCWNDNSITRSNKSNFFVEEMRTFIFSISELCKELERRGKTENLPSISAGFLLHIYFSLYDPRFDFPQYMELKNQCVEDVREFYRLFKTYYDKFSKEEFAELYLLKKERFKTTVETGKFKTFIDNLCR